MLSREEKQAKEEKKRRLKQSLSSQIREKRQTMGWSQADMAVTCNVTTLSYQKWEKGVSFPSDDKLAILCRFFNIDIEQFID